VCQKPTSYAGRIPRKSMMIRHLTVDCVMYSVYLSKICNEITTSGRSK
jgi:hypothetical protein